MASDIRMSRRKLDQLLFNALTAIYKFEQDKVSHFDLSYGQIYLLQLLRRQSPSRMSEIAYRMGMPISTTTRFIAKMEKMQLLERVADAKDRRVILVSLKEKGEKTVKAVEDHSFSLLSSNLREFSEDELNAFIMTAGCLDRILGTRSKNLPAGKCK